MGFDNKTISERTDKPVICKRNGYWRVSALCKPYSNKELWRKAYEYISNLNFNVNVKVVVKQFKEQLANDAEPNS